MIRRDFRDRNGDGAIEILRPIIDISDFCDQDFQFTDFRERRTESPFLSATFATKAEMVRPQRSSRTGATGATKLKCFRTFATEVERARFLQPAVERCDFIDQGGDGATL